MGWWVGGGARAGWWVGRRKRGREGGREEEREREGWLAGLKEGGPRKIAGQGRAVGGGQGMPCGTAAERARREGGQEGGRKGKRESEREWREGEQKGGRHGAGSGERSGRERTGGEGGNKRVPAAQERRVRLDPLANTLFRPQQVAQLGAHPNGIPDHILQPQQQFPPCGVQRHPPQKENT